MRHVPIILAIIALFSWGLWVFFANLAGETLSGEMIVIITFFVGGMVGIGYSLIWGVSLTVQSTAVIYAITSGVFFGIGGLAYYAALRRGPTSVTTTIAALYFVVASIAAWVFLGESVRPRDIVGIGLAIGAVAILAS